MTEAPGDASLSLQRAQRQAVRRRLLDERSRFASSPAAAIAAQALASALCDVVADLDPDCLGLYTPLRSEFNAGPWLAADPRLADLSLALPYARSTKGEMEFRRWDGGPTTCIDPCGIGSSSGAVVVPDVVVVPCVGITADGHRLGYGGGYYDRWLAGHPHVTSIGVAWSFAEIGADDFCVAAHDVTLSLIVTERGVR